MRLLWCMVMVAVVGGAAVIQDLYDGSSEEDNSDVLSRSLTVDDNSDENEDDDRQAKSLNLASFPLAYHIPSSVPVQPLSYLVPGVVYNAPRPLPAPPRTPASTVFIPMLGQTAAAAGGARSEGDAFMASARGNAFETGVVYNAPRPLPAPPRTPASTVLIPMLGQTAAAAGGARSEGDAFMASARGNAFETCFWLFQQCTGIDINNQLFPSNFAMPGVTPGYLRYGFGPVPSVQYPVHVGPQAGPVPVTYGAGFWCAIFAWKCLPDISNLPIRQQNIIRQGLVPN